MINLERGQFERALPQLERRVAITRSHGSEPTISLGWALVNLANTERFLGRAGAAEVHAQEATAVFRKTLGESHPSLIHPIAILAWAMSVQGEKGAEELMRQGEAIQQKLLAPDNYEHAVGLTFLGFVLMNEGKLGEARQDLARALEIRRKNFAAPNWRIAETAGFLGESIARQGQRDAARPLLEESLDTFSRLYGPGNVRAREAQIRLERWGR